MKKFKINSNKKVLIENYDVVFPELGGREMQAGVTTFALTSKEKVKLEKLRAKYKVSRSALVRILINQALLEE